MMECSEYSVTKGLIEKWPDCLIGHELEESTLSVSSSSSSERTDTVSNKIYPEVQHAHIIMTGVEWQKIAQIPKEKCPPNYFCFSILILLIAPCCGIPALYYSTLSRKKYKSGDTDGTWKYSKKALFYCCCGLALVAVLLLLCFIMFVLVRLSIIPLGCAIGPWICNSTKAASDASTLNPAKELCTAKPLDEPPFILEDSRNQSNVKEDKLPTSMQTLMKNSNRRLLPENFTDHIKNSKLQSIFRK